MINLHFTQKRMAMADVSAIEEGKDVSLIALTSHFAQVQFRLKQITSSPPDKRERLLRQLEEFAFQGCPVELSFGANSEANTINGGSPSQDHLHRLLANLQVQLAELVGAPPSSPASFDKQNIVLDELSKQFDVQFEDLESLSESEVRVRVNEAILKKHNSTQKDSVVVRQLISQVRLMEEYISQLHSELSVATSTSPTTIPTEVAGDNDTGIPQYSVKWGQDTEEDGLMTLHRASSEESLVTPLVIGKKNQKGMESLQRTLALMQILTLGGCAGRFKLSGNKLPLHINEYPKAVRTLELAVDKISLIATALNEPGLQPTTRVRLESELFEVVSMSLSDSLQELLEHGWAGQSHVVPSSCLLPSMAGKGTKILKKTEDCIAWKTLLYYYLIKKGPKVCDKPDLKLSSSFCLPVDASLKPKQTLLTSIYHTDKCFTDCLHYRKDVKFRSLVCEGFNIHHLYDWIRIIATHPSLVDDLYHSTSFMAITKFRPALQILERLSTAPKVPPVSLPSSYYHHVNNN